jgi:hypothetical protein
MWKILRAAIVAIVLSAVAFVAGLAEVGVLESALLIGFITFVLVYYVQVLERRQKRV